MQIAPKQQEGFFPGVKAGCVRVGSWALGKARFQVHWQSRHGGREGSGWANRMLTPLLSWATLLQVTSLGLGFEETHPDHNSLR